MSYSRDSSTKCADDIRQHCKRYYVTAGPVTNPEGRKKCRQALKDAGVWGRDKTSKCKIDLECNHQGCAEEDETHGSFGTIVSEVAPSLPSNIDLAKKTTFSMFNRNNGGKRKSRKGKRSKKIHKTRKSKKSRKSHKSKKSRKSKKP